MLAILVAKMNCPTPLILANGRVVKQGIFVVCKYRYIIIRYCGWLLELKVLH